MVAISFLPLPEVLCGACFLDDSIQNLSEILRQGKSVRETLNHQIDGIYDLIF